MVTDKHPRILLRLPNWIGDAVMATPVVHALGRTVPEADWLLLGAGRTAPLFTGFDRPYRTLSPLPPGSSRPDRFLGVAKSLRRERADAALLFPPSFSSAMLARSAGVSIRVGWSGDGRSPLLTHVVSQPPRSVHLRKQYWDLGREFCQVVFGRELRHAEDLIRLPLTVAEIADAHRWWANSSLDPARTVALAPGATFGATKRWPESHFRELAVKLRTRGWSLLWFGGAEEAELCQRLSDVVSPGPEEGFSLAGKSSLRESLARLAQVRLMVSNDSGAMHLADAVGLPLVAIFGSTSPTWTGPIGPDARVIYDDLACSPCFGKTCPTQIECLRDLSPARVFEETVDVLDQPRSSGRPAVFLDRDGTLVKLVPYLDRPDQLVLEEGAAEALRALRDAGFALVVITNQSVVARGQLGLPGLDLIHRRLRELLSAEGIELTGIEVCPHHPEFTGACDCRKPLPGMLERAAQRYDLDLARSVMIGDTRSDFDAGLAAGARSLFVRTGYGRKESAGIDSAWVFDDLRTSAHWIVSSEYRPSQR